MEEQLELLGASVDRLADAMEFHRQLKAGDASSEGQAGS